jgi:23S rRNA (guanosine2251-2'-O)-methyltransferase
VPSAAAPTRPGPPVRSTAPPVPAARGARWGRRPRDRRRAQPRRRGAAGEGAATALYVALGVDADERVTEAVALAGKAHLAILEVSRAELDRMTGRALHQGLALQVPPYAYLHPDELRERALAAPAPLLVALDGVTDPRNLGAVVRSAAAFGAQGVLVPERRSAGMTRRRGARRPVRPPGCPVARCTNLARTLGDYRDAACSSRARRGGGGVARRPRAGDRAARRRRRVGGRGPGTPGRADLRPDGVDPDGRRQRVAERRHRRGRDARRGRAPRRTA